MRRFEPPFLGAGFGGGVAFAPNGDALVSAPFAWEARPNAGAVYRYDPQTGTRSHTYLNPEPKGFFPGGVGSVISLRRGPDLIVTFYQRGDNDTAGLNATVLSTGQPTRPCRPS
jgi:hypothetical protein